MAIKATAAEYAISVSEFVRRAIFSRKVEAIPPQVNRNTYKQLCGLTNNLNQVVKLLHQGHHVPVNTKLLKELIDVVRAVCVQLLPKK